MNKSEMNKKCRYQLADMKGEIKGLIKRRKNQG